ncbi:PIG-L family deacetylase [Nocardia yamanashiensis]|uniref:PIG-L deacetylase family protein n=1 Tax=Nocardia yamanashiensis TaxID=209247 RepID=UPI001E58D41C|nr:PIG-L family deacetylase [Nocardia yamanashiensis]UGT44507.1 PIG-L family deacetylase [Nocardia yamanashiensis]
MIRLDTGGVRELALLGAHCDDLAIGLGGTLLTLSNAVPGLRIRALVLSGAGTERAFEEQAALEAFCPGADLDLRILDVPDGYAPAHWERVKDAVGALRRGSHAQVVFAPQRRDAHQDHRLLAELTPTEFRDHLVLGYEILKWENDTPQPTVFHPLPAALAEAKAALLLKHYPSQRNRDWFDEQSFLALSRLRGVQCRAPHAEAFLLDKATITFGGA